MKKIMFSDEYGLTKAVLVGRKTMTRRVVSEGIIRIAKKEVEICGGELTERIKDHTFYCYLEEVAVAQNYKECWDVYQQRWEAVGDPENWRTPDAILGDDVQSVKAWTNKMFVKAELMPHHIRITDIKLERLQDISDEDCMKEGVKEVRHPFVKEANNVYVCQGIEGFYTHPKDCFADLIDKVSGKGTWNRNPFVFAYTFELVEEGGPQ